MEVGAGAEPGASDVADGLAFRDHLTGRDGELGLVGVEGAQPPPVINDDRVAVAAVRLRQDHDARGSGPDGCAWSGINVDAGVQLAGLEDRMNPVAEGR